jgi:hypothetical protein
MAFRLSGALCATILSACLVVPAVSAAKEKAPPVPAGPPLKVLVLPVDFDMLEFSAAGMIEPVPAETTQAEEQLLTSVHKVLRITKKFQIVDMPALSDAERELLKEHVALYKLSAFNAGQMLRMGGPAWKAKRTNFDYSIGDGLKFLIERSGADAAVVVGGFKVSSSGGRVAMALLLAAAGIAIPLGGAQTTAGVVDLNTGNIRWLDERLGTKGDVKDRGGADQTVNAVLGQYPASTLLGVKAQKKR